MANTLVAADFDLASNICRYLTAKVTLHLEIGLNVLTQRQQLIVGEVLHADVGINPGRRQGLLGQGATNTINIGQGDFNPFVTGNIDSSETCHFFSCCTVKVWSIVGARAFSRGVPHWVGS